MNNVEINDIYYNLNECEKTAQVTENHNKYSSAVSIPETVSYNGKTYTVTSIGDRAFWDCTGLTSVNIPDSVTSIGDDAFWSCKGLTSINIPDSVTSIGDEAFCHCSGLRSINISNSVTKIGEFAFHNCEELTSVTIPNSVKSIQVCAFADCKELISVNIPDSVTSIGEGAFADCKRLADVYCYAENMPSTERIVFNNSDIRKATLHVPAASIEQYKTTEPWSNFGTIVAIDDTETQAS